MKMKNRIVALIEKARRGEHGISTRIKVHYKLKKFQKYAQIGDNLNICSRADCTADHASRIQIGNRCRIYGAIRSVGDGRITIGDHTAIYERSIVGSVNSIQIGSCVMISNHVHIYDNNNHPTSSRVRREMCLGGFEGDAWSWIHAESKPIVIEDNVWIGEYAMIMKGVTIGEGAIVAAHAVVTKDVPPHTIAAGNPARIVKEIRDEET